MTESQTKVWILIPAYNEAKSLPSVLAGIRHSGYQNILVVNDGSTDNTAALSRQHGATVISLPHNQGQGAALQQGIRYLAHKHQPDIIVTFDADGQHDSSDIAAIVSPVAARHADIALGSRFLYSQNKIPASRRLVLRAGVLFTNAISGLALTDTHNGFRAFSRRAYTLIRLHHNRMAHASDIIDEIARHHLRYQEVPVRVWYKPSHHRRGQSVWSFIHLGIQIILNKIKNALFR